MLIFYLRRCMPALLWQAVCWCAFATSAHALSLAEAESFVQSTPPPQVLAAAARAQVLHAQAAVNFALPPPQLLLGIENIPVSGNAAWQLPPDEGGMATVGIMQMLPSGKRRALLGERGREEAGAAEALHAADVRSALRAVRLTYIDLWRAEEAIFLAENSASEANKSLAAVDAAYRAGRATLAERAQAAVAPGLIRDRVMQHKQNATQAREQLARWLGDAAINATVIDAPALSAPPSESFLLAQLDAHPEMQVVLHEQQARARDADIARAASRPDWRLEARYGWRGAMPDTASVMLGVELPLVSVGRRRHELAGALSAGEESAARREELARSLRADIRAASHHHAFLRERLSRFDLDVVDAAQRRVEAALAGYRSGRDTFEAVVSARQAAIDVAQMRLELYADLLRMQAELLYFAPTSAQEQAP